MKKSFVSIIIPNYNKEKYIIEAIDSALNQTYKPNEVMVVYERLSGNSSEILKQRTFVLTKGKSDANR